MTLLLPRCRRFRTVRHASLAKHQKKTGPCAELAGPISASLRVPPVGSFPTGKPDWEPLLVLTGPISTPFRVPSVGPFPTGKPDREPLLVLTGPISTPFRVPSVGPFPTGKPDREPLWLRGSVVSRIFALVASLVVAGALRAPVASAHASVSSTSPEAGSTVAESPREVTITFDQGISVPNGGVRVLNEQAERIGVEKPRVGAKPGLANTVSVAVPALRGGAYVVSWRAISEDGHPIRGAFTFRVGSGGDQAAVAKLARELLTNGKADPALSITMAIARALSFASMLVLLGGVAYVLLLRPQAAGNDRRVSRLLTAAAITAGISGLVTVLTFGPYAAGEGFGGLRDGTLLDDTIASNIGRSLLLRTVALAALGFLLLRMLSPVRSENPSSIATNANKPSPRTNQDDTAQGDLTRDATGAMSRRVWGTCIKRIGRTSNGVAAMGLSLVILGLSTLIGHGTTGHWGLLGALATGAHLGAAATWIGLLVLVLAATSGTDQRTHPRIKPTWTNTKQAASSAGNQRATPTTDEVLVLVERFSTLAFWSVAVLVLSGMVNGLRQIGTVQGLTSTNYGRLLLTKLGLVAVLVGLGWLSRTSLAKRRAAVAERALQKPTEPSQRTHLLPERQQAAKALPPALVAIRRRMFIESVVAVGVVAITALLVNAPPPLEVLGKPVTVTMRGTALLLDSTISPAQSGKNRLHFYALTPEGQTQAVENMTVTASLPANDIAPIDLKVVRAGPNHFQTLAADLPVKGPWRFIVEVQLDTFTAESVAATINIR
jgi:copper transport protein